MKLTIAEYDGIVESRLVDLENALQTYKDNQPIVCNNDNIAFLQNVVKRANALLEAYEAKVEAEEDATGEELEKGYKLDMTAGLDEALGIRKGE